MPDKCKHSNYKGSQDAVEVYKAYKSAWYALHPKGARNSWFDTWLADAIPVVFQAEYIDSVPFGDMLNYTKLMVYVPQKIILGKRRKNIVDILLDNFDENDNGLNTSIV